MMLVLWASVNARESGQGMPVRPPVLHDILGNSGCQGGIMNRTFSLCCPLYTPASTVLRPATLVLHRAQALLGHSRGLALPLEKP